MHFYFFSVNANGKMIARINQNIDSDSSPLGGSPSTRIQTEINVPSKGIHKNILQQFPREHQLTENGNRRTAALDALQETNNNVSWPCHSILCITCRIKR